MNPPAWRTVDAAGKSLAAAGKADRTLPDPAQKPWPDPGLGPLSRTEATARNFWPICYMTQPSPAPTWPLMDRVRSATPSPSTSNLAVVMLRPSL